jgi:4-hydroxy-tetrahydrodipicolinate reductase
MLLLAPLDSRKTDFDTFKQSFTNSNCMIAANFAIGAVLMMRFAEMASPFFDTAEIIEIHHDGKADSPSGTAVATAQRMAAASSQWAKDPTKHEVIPGGRGAKGPWKHSNSCSAHARRQLQTKK